MFLFVINLTAIGFYSLGHVFSVLATDVNMAISMATPILCTQLLFSGFFLDKTANHPQWLNFFRHFSIFNYSYELLFINQWENVQELTCEYDIEVLCISTGKEVLSDANLSKVAYFLYEIFI